VVWYVADAHPDLGVEGAASQQGPGHRSRVRPLTERILAALFAAEPALASCQGLFISPYVAQAAAANGWLADHGGAAGGFKGGVRGDTAAGGAGWGEWRLPPEVDAMIVTLGGNDMLRGLDPAQARANLDKILSVAAGRDLPVLLVGMEAPGNYGPDYKKAFDGMYPDLAQAYGALFFESFFKGLGDGGPAELQGFFQGDRIHPNAEGVAKIVAAMGPKVAELAALAQE